jgi:hypothetical protein
VPIDTNTPTGKAFEQLAKDLFKRRRRLDWLYAYYSGEPPLPEGMSQPPRRRPRLLPHLAHQLRRADLRGAAGADEAGRGAYRGR